MKFSHIIALVALALSNLSFAAKYPIQPSNLSSEQLEPLSWTVTPIADSKEGHERVLVKIKVDINTASCGKTPIQAAMVKHKADLAVTITTFGIYNVSLDCDLGDSQKIRTVSTTVELNPEKVQAVYVKMLDGTLVDILTTESN
jgi:hypothetical protein